MQPALNGVLARRYNPAGLRLGLNYLSPCDYIAHAYKIPHSSFVVAENSSPRFLVRKSFDASLDSE